MSEICIACPPSINTVYKHSTQPSALRLCLAVHAREQAARAVDGLVDGILERFIDLLLVDLLRADADEAERCLDERVVLARAARRRLPDRQRVPQEEGDGLGGDRIGNVELHRHLMAPGRQFAEQALAETVETVGNKKNFHVLHFFTKHAYG